MAAGTWIALHVVFRVSGINLRCKNHVKKLNTIALQYQEVLRVKEGEKNLT